MQDGCAGALSGSWSTEEGKKKRSDDEVSNVAGDDDDDDAEEMSPAPGLAPGLALAGEGGRREACCEEIKALNAAECFCREDVMAVLRTFPANFRAMFAAAPDACGVTVRHEGRARVGGTLLTPQFSRRMNSTTRCLVSHSPHPAPTIISRVSIMTHVYTSVIAAS